MPIETPHGISRRAPPPICCQSGSLVQARFQIPDRRFQAAARHLVPADMRGQRRDIVGARQFAAQHARGGIIAQDQPCRLGPLLVVERVFARRDFAPAGDAVAIDLDQDDVALGSAAEAGLEEMHQRHADLPQRDDLLDFHSQRPNRYVPASGDRSKPTTASPLSEIAVRTARRSACLNLARALWILAAQRVRSRRAPRCVLDSCGRRRAAGQRRPSRGRSRSTIPRCSGPWAGRRAEDWWSCRTGSPRSAGRSRPAAPC